MSKSKCTKCEGIHHDEQDCVVHWREKATFYLRRWEDCSGALKESELMIKARKEIDGLTKVNA